MENAAMSDHDFAKAVRSLTKTETNDEALQVLRVADEALEKDTAIVGEGEVPEEIEITGTEPETPGLKDRLFPDRSKKVDPSDFAD